MDATHLSSIDIMTFSASFDIYLGCFSHVIFFPSLYVIFSCLLKSLVIFGWMPCSVKFMMLIEYRIFFISCNYS